MLWRPSTNTEYGTIGHLFAVSKESVCMIVHAVLLFIISPILKSKMIKFPKGAELDRVLHGYEEKWGFPQCGGAIDGSHIPIIGPNVDRANYYNRKGWYSIILQAVVDDRYRFTDIMEGCPGSVHDARVFANSKLFKKGEDGTLFPNINREISGVQVPVVLLGEPAYPLLPWLMKPYSDDVYLQLSSARMTVENSFGRLKGRWRCLLNRNDTCIRKIPIW